jgi:hypothetical protein
MRIQMNKASKVKFVLGLIVMTSCAALTSPANAGTLKSNPTFGDIMSQAKLNLKSSTQQLESTSASTSWEKLQQGTGDLRCDGGGSSNGSNC